MTHPNKPFKAYTEEDWEEFYNDPQNFAQIFHDLEILKDADARSALSSSGNLRLKVVTNKVDSLVSGNPTI